ncbi:FKBP-type peptidyl-prolyl cis-trans isomerase [Sulfurospirillum arcachonense]|uniref:FKBP-type peptidyl-prolyl cis-trans isomerase n=1 Tax=Sulfurospirillum arcachonense TaxID=57666 RepID=UPI00046880DC|nr:peptidylprolyl isomerase [Sulfurospirillum arcachonense]
MAIIDNQVVSINYELKDVASGEVIDSNLEAAPLSFIVGKGQIIPGLENEIKNLSQGDTADINVSAKDGYGEYDDSAIQSLPKEQFAGLELTEGMTLYGQGEDGGTVQVVVKSFDEEQVHVDFNHPLAGKDLLFSISITEVREATEEELANGFVGAPAGGGCGCGSSAGDSCCSTDKADDHECCGGEHHEKDGSGCCGSH